MLDTQLRLLKFQEIIIDKTNGTNEEAKNTFIRIFNTLAKDEHDNIMNFIKDYDEHITSFDDEYEYLKELKEKIDKVTDSQKHAKELSIKYNFDIEESNFDDVDVNYIEDRLNNFEELFKKENEFKANNNLIEDTNKKLDDENNKDAKNKDNVSKFEDYIYEKLKGYINSKNYIDDNEYGQFGYDLYDLISTNTIDETYKKVEKEKKDIEENYNTCKMCYDNLEDKSEFRDVLEASRKDFLLKNYECALIGIAKYINTKDNDIDKCKKKVDTLSKLFQIRKTYLTNQDIYLENDLLGKISNTFDIIRNMDDHTKEIDKLSKKISKLEKENESLSEDIDIIRSKLQFRKDLIISNIGISDIDLSDVKDNQVIDVKDIDDDFKIDIALEKCDNVLKRVRKLFLDEDDKFLENNENKNDISIEEEVTNPEIVIEEIETNSDIKNEDESLNKDNVEDTEIKDIKEEIVDNELEKDNVSEAIFEDEVQSNDNSNIENSSIFEDDSNKEINNNESIFEDNELKKDNISDSIFEDENKSNDSDLFANDEDNIFDENITLFNDKQDSDDVFWDIPEESNAESIKEDKEVITDSFDEKVRKLMK